MLKRRRFIGKAISFSTISLIPSSLFSQKKITFQKQRLPNRLKKGDVIGLIAPGYAIKANTLEKIKQTLISMGFVPYYTYRLIGENYGYFSNTDIERANDLNEMFTNDKVKGILCARGGYGCTRIMSMIDYNTIKENPKILIGFSDITALLNGIHKETGLITFHGPVGSTLESLYSIKQLEKIILKPKKNTIIKSVVMKKPELIDNPEFERYIITEGKVVGKLVGGSLTLITALVGTPHEIDFTDSIVCIEDIEESPYRIDRMLTQLIEGSTLKKAAAIVFGVCKGCDKPKKDNSFTLKEVILDRIKPLNIPAIYGMSFGHVKDNFTIPIGLQAELDTEKMTIRLLESAVI